MIIHMERPMSPVPVKAWEGSLVVSVRPSGGRRLAESRQPAVSESNSWVPIRDALARYGGVSFFVLVSLQT